MIPGKAEVRRRRNWRSWRVGVHWEKGDWSGPPHPRYTRVWIDLLCWTWIVTRWEGAEHG